MTTTVTPYHTILTAQRDEWAQQLADVRNKITSATDELTRLQQGAIALDGAITATDVLLQKFTALDVPSDIPSV